MQGVQAGAASDLEDRGIALLGTAPVRLRSSGMRLDSSVVTQLVWPRSSWRSETHRKILEFASKYII